MSTPRCEVCGEKCVWLTGKQDYELISFDVHIKCVKEFRVLEQGFVAVHIDDLKELQRRLISLGVPSDVIFNRYLLEGK